MKFAIGKLFPVVLIFLLLLQSATATDGYLSAGYGTRQLGKAGAGIAASGDALAQATNPAALIGARDRIDLGLTLFRPVRFGAISGNTLPPGYPDVNGSYDANRVVNFVIPEFGISRELNGRVVYGIALYGNGGMNTSYKTPIPLLGTTRGGVDLEQVFLAPAVALKLDKRNTVGVSANLLYQRFAAEGLENFANPAYSIDPAHVTNTGHSNSYGFGVRIGWQAELDKFISVGATYQSRTYATAFDRYKGLFAEGGKFDVPANFGAGVLLHLTPRVNVEADEERILYSSVKSIANSDANQAQLGAANGPGFGWHSINALKAGVEVEAARGVTVRAGYNHSGLPFDKTQTFFNLLAPAVVQDHLHAGATFKRANGNEISVAYVHAFNNTLNGDNSIAPSYGGGNANLSMYQNSFSVAYAWAKR